MVIVPIHSLDNLKAYPEDAISFCREIYDGYLGKYTSVASNSSAMINYVKLDLNKSIEENTILWKSSKLLKNHTNRTGIQRPLERTTLHCMESSMEGAKAKKARFSAAKTFPRGQ